MNNLLPNRTPPEIPQAGKRSVVKPAVLTLLVAFLLLAGSIWGAFATCGSMNSQPSPSFKFFASCAYLFFGIFVLAAAWLLLSLIIWLVQVLMRLGK